MKNYRFKIALLLFSSFLIFSGCDKNDDDSTKLETFTVLIDATSYTDWVYYSFSEGSEVAVADPKTSTNWDIGLRRNHFSTNSGSSGNAQGGVFDAGVVDFDSYLEAPEMGYAIDDSIPAFSFATMTYENIAASSVLETWGEFTVDNPPTLIVSDKVFAVKTADGKYAKMIVQNYYGTEGSGYITFTYAYQPDGTTNLASKAD